MKVTPFHHSPEAMIHSASCAGDRLPRLEAREIGRHAGGVGFAVQEELVDDGQGLGRRKAGQTPRGFFPNRRPNRVRPVTGAGRTSPGLPDPGRHPG